MKPGALMMAIAETEIDTRHGGIFISRKATCPLVCLATERLRQVHVIISQRSGFLSRGIDWPRVRMPAEFARMDNQEQSLIEKVSGGDHSAFGPLMALHRDRLKRMISIRLDSRLKGRVDESDVYQELQLDAIRRLPEYVSAPNVAFFSWLRFLGRQKLAEMTRRHVHAQARDVRREVRPGQLAGEDSSIALASFLVGEVTSPSLQVSRRELREKIELAIASLEESDREVLLLRHAEQLSASEAAAELGIPAGTFRQRHLRALQRLKTALEQNNLDWIDRDG